MTSYYRQMHAYVRPRADFVAVVSWAIVLVAALVGILRSIRFTPEDVSALIKWPIAHWTNFVIGAAVVIVLHTIYRIVSFDREAEILTMDAVAALDSGGSTQTTNSRLLDRLTIEIACVVKIRLGLPTDNPANRQAAWREASAYMREITRPGAKHQDLRISHRPMHLAGAVTLVFLPTEADMLAKRISSSLTMRQRRRFVSGDVPDFADALLSMMQSRPARPTRSGRQSPQPSINQHTSEPSGPRVCLIDLEVGGPPAETNQLVQMH